MAASVATLPGKNWPWQPCLTLWFNRINLSIYQLFEQGMSKNVRIKNQQNLFSNFTVLFLMFCLQNHNGKSLKKFLIPQSIQTKKKPPTHCVTQTISFCQENSLRLYQPSCWVQNSRLTDWDFGPKVPSWLVSKIGFDVNFLRQDTHNMCTIRNSWRFLSKKWSRVRYVQLK